MLTNCSPTVSVSFAARLLYTVLLSLLCLCRVVSTYVCAGAIMNEVVEGISHLSTTGGGAASATTHHSSAGISDNRL